MESRPDAPTTAHGESIDPSPRLTIGAAVGPYRIERLLGAGGMGQVYLASDSRIGRTVALKAVGGRLADSPDARRSAIAEARAAGRLSHPNIASIYDIVDHDGVAVIVMEFVEGQSLRDRLAAGPLPVATAVGIALELADALEYVHAQGVVHCDIKPGNIQLMPAGHVKLLDFGVARRLADTVTLTSTVAFGERKISGTPAYMSPEQRSGRGVDRRSDIYSLGMVLAEMLHGTRLGADALPAPRRSTGTVPAPVQAVIDRAVAVERDARFQTAAEFRHALQDAASPRSIVTRARRFARAAARPAPLSALVLVLAGLAGAAYFGLMRERPIIAPAGERWYRDGLIALREGAPAQAASALERAVEIDPASALAWARLGEARLELDQESAAKDAVLRAASLEPNRLSLGAEHRQALEGAMAMVNRDYARAIAAYEAMLARQPESSAVLVDLGRAHEASESTQAALEYYERASALDPESAAPFVRAGILRARREEVDRAAAAFDKAYELHEAARRLEGLAAVEFQRGVLFQRVSRYDDARAALERALKLAEAGNSPYWRAAALFRLSSVAGAVGRRADAESQAAEALKISQGFDSLTAFGLVDLGNAFVPVDHQRARDYFQQALARAQTAGARRAEARASLALGSLEISVGRIEDGVRLTRAALKYYEQTGFRALRTLALTLLARAFERTGDLAGAQASYESLLKTAEDAKNVEQIAQQHYVLGGVLARRERYSAALPHAEAAVKRYVQLGMPDDAAYARVRVVQLLSKLGRVGDAERELGAMSTPAEPPADQPGLRRLVVLARATLFADQYRFREAIDAAREGLAAPGDDPRAAASLQLLLAEAFARRGSLPAAVAHLQQAEALRAPVGDVTFSSALDLAQAEVALLQRGFEAAYTAAEAIARQADQAGRYETAWTASLIAEQAALGHGDREGADRHRTQADAVWARFEAQFDQSQLPAVRARFQWWRDRWAK